MLTPEQRADWQQWGACGHSEPRLFDDATAALFDAVNAHLAELEAAQAGRLVAGCRCPHCGRERAKGGEAE